MLLRNLKHVSTTQNKTILNQHDNFYTRSQKHTNLIKEERNVKK